MIIETEEQKRVIDNAVHHIKYGDELVYQFAGWAGTGKTFTIKRIIERIGIPLSRVAVMTYIGQAAIVLRTKGLWNAKTIHSWMYELVKEEIVNEKGEKEIDPIYNKPKVKLTFRPKKLVGIDYIIIDEAGTVPRYMKKDIESQGIKIIACGDLGQLPPVKDKPAYLYEGKIDYLTQPMRQNINDGIYYLSTRARSGLPIHAGFYGNAMVIEEQDLSLETIMNSQIIICGKNSTRDKYNNLVRNNILNHVTKLPQFGEKIICRKNNWDLEVDGISLANGLICQVINPPSVTDFDGKIFKIDIKPDLLNSFFENIMCDYNYFTADSDTRRLLKNDKYSIGEKFEFAYAITTHLSQGAEYRNGIYISEFLNRDIQNNLDYTGITRFTDGLIYVIPNRKYF